MRVDGCCHHGVANSWLPGRGGEHLRAGPHPVLHVRDSRARFLALTGGGVAQARRALYGGLGVEVLRQPLQDGVVRAPQACAIYATSGDMLPMRVWGSGFRV